MYVNAIGRNYYNTPYVRKEKISKPSFKGIEFDPVQGGLNDAETKKVLDMLKSKITAICGCSSLGGVIIFIEALAKKYEGVPGAPGIMLIPDNELAGFLGDSFAGVDLRDFKGLCIAYGDKAEPLKNWSYSRETIVLLIPKSEFQSKPTQDSRGIPMGIPHNKYPS